MVWFLLAPIAAYGIKKLYDAATEPASSSGSSPGNSLGPAKAERTRVRSEAIMARFREHYDRVGRGLGNINLSSGLGPVKIDAKTAGVVKAEFEGYARALEALNNARACLDGRTFGDRPMLYLELKMPNAVELREQMLHKAVADYGSMAGITVTHTYDQRQDPFLTALRKA